MLRSFRLPQTTTFCTLSTSSNTFSSASSSSSSSVLFASLANASSSSVRVKPTRRKRSKKPEPVGRIILQNLAKKKEAAGEHLPYWLRRDLKKDDSPPGQRRDNKDLLAPEGKRQRRRSPTFLRVEDVETQNAVAFGVEKEKLPPPSAEQQQIIDFAVSTGRNVFITGGAGVGKSVALRQVIEALGDAAVAGGGGRDSLRVAAPTGVAAMNIGGLTLHSLFGLFPGDENDPNKLERKLRVRAAVKAAASGTAMPQASSSLLQAAAAAAAQPAGEFRRLVVDEVSMVSPAMFEAAQLFCRHMGPRPDLAWGGVQLILCGDFLQLPPVHRQTEAQVQQRQANDLLRDFGAGASSEATNEKERMKKYCFQTDAWAQGMFHRFDLRHPFRQKDDADFLSFLNDARVGKVQHSFLFRKLSSTAPASQQEKQQRQHALAEQTKPATASSPTGAPDQQQPSSVVQIRATNAEVDAINKTRYDAISLENKRLEAELLDDNADTSLLSLEPHRRPAFETVFVAHTTGKCSDGNALRDTSVVQRLPLQRGTRVVLLRNLDVKKGLVNGRLGTVVDFERLPPRLRAPVGGGSGSSLSKRRKKMSSSSSSGPALASQLKVDHVAPDGVLPIVEFDQVGPVCVLPFVWSLTSGTEVLGTATQLPLRQAWSITSHRSQGLTLDRVEVDLRRFFDSGQGYVALSRARTADGLKVLSASKAQKAIRACPVALEFQLGAELEDENKKEKADE